MEDFVASYLDHSTSSGFQFEFRCDRCNLGYRSTYEPSNINLAAGVMQAASAMFGGVFGRISYGADQLKEGAKARARDQAYQKAVAEMRQKFRQCGPCRKWVCPSCWSERAGTCTACAGAGGPPPAAAAAAASCPRCGAAARAGAQFCSQCGASLAQAGPKRCRGCGAELDPGAKFCSGCGEGV